MILQRLILAGLLSVIGTAILMGQEIGFAINYKESDASRVTSSSELYDPSKLTAAHNTIPFGTMVNVTRLDNGLSVVVKINDRGPFTPNRIMALSKAAASKIGLKKYEKVNVQFYQKRNLQNPWLKNQKKNLTFRFTSREVPKQKQRKQRICPCGLRPLKARKHNKTLLQKEALCRFL
jgi:rare lipoprotein A